MILTNIRGNCNISKLVLTYIGIFDNDVYKRNRRNCSKRDDG